MPVSNCKLLCHGHGPHLYACSLTHLSLTKAAHSSDAGVAAQHAFHIHEEAGCGIEVRIGCKKQ